MVKLGAAGRNFQTEFGSLSRDNLKGKLSCSVD